MFSSCFAIVMVATPFFLSLRLLLMFLGDHGWLKAGLQYIHSGFADFFQIVWCLNVFGCIINFGLFVSVYSS